MSLSFAIFSCFTALAWNYYAKTKFKISEIKHLVTSNNFEQKRHHNNFDIYGPYYTVY